MPFMNLTKSSKWIPQEPIEANIDLRLRTCFYFIFLTMKVVFEQANILSCNENLIYSENAIWKVTRSSSSLKPLEKNVSLCVLQWSSKWIIYYKLVEHGKTFTVQCYSKHLTHLNDEFKEKKKISLAEVPPHHHVYFIRNIFNFLTHYYLLVFVVIMCSFQFNLDSFYYFVALQPVPLFITDLWLITWR